MNTKVFKRNPKIKKTEMIQMEKITQTEIINKIENEKDELTAVEIIRNHKNHKQCSVILNDELFSIPYETDCTPELANMIKETINPETLLIMFDDYELAEGWKQAYLKGGIPEERHDRRVIPRQYNDMNELFCVDRNLLWDLTDEFKGTPHELTEERCAWRFHAIQWYKAHLI